MRRKRALALVPELVKLSGKPLIEVANGVAQLGGKRLVLGGGGLIVDVEGEGLLVSHGVLRLVADPMNEL
jgi:hypothetical protein